MLKRILSLALATVLVLGLCACGNTEPGPETTGGTEPAPTTMDWTKKDTLKVLTLGHSLTVDANHMLALVAAAEGYTGLTVGTLYYSGCPLYRHVQFIKSDAPEYALYISDSADASAPPERLSDVTISQAVRHLDWDIIVMQGGGFELTKDSTFQDGNIQFIQKFVNENKYNQDAIFAWHMPWAFATMPDLQAKYTAGGNPYITGYAPFGNDRLALYKAFTATVEKFIMTDETFQFLIPTGTAIENAMSSYLTEYDLIRDYAHATDYGRLIAAYTWYCKLRGVEQLTELKLTTIPKAFFKSTQSTEDRALTEMEQKLLLESVNNALKTPLAVTQSQYTTAPTE